MVHDYKLARERMVKKQLIPRGIKDPLVLAAMNKIYRHLFMEEALEGEAYNDHPVPIGHKQTISQPYIVALMTQALELSKDDKVLEVGTGSGYQTAILAEISRAVHTIERIRPLMERARGLLNKLDYYNVLYKAFDGTLGWNEFAPYDAIIITAGSPKIPKAYVGQLAEGGRMVIPVGSKVNQNLIKITKREDKIFEQDLGSCRFVDLIGIDGWKD